MKVLLDENLSRRLRSFLPGHEVFTVSYLGWSGLRNGDLLQRAVKEGFEVIVTMDASMPKQQSLRGVSISLVVLHAASNDLGDLLPLVPELLRVLRRIGVQSIVHIPSVFD